MAKKVFKQLFVEDAKSSMGTTSKGSSAQEIVMAKKAGLRFGDSNSKDFEPPEFEMTGITNGYNTDGYIRQGVDKYVDQIFKEGFDLVGKDTNILDYLNMRFKYMGLVTGTPYEQFVTEVAEDLVKYGNAIIAKVRMTDQSQLPQGISATGLNGAQPIVGYYCLNPSTMSIKRDKNGTVQGWQQEVAGNDKKAKFKPEDIVHIYYKREKGNAFGTSFLVPVLDDVRALRQAEENVLRMIYRNIYPFYHVKVGTQDSPGQTEEVTNVQQQIDGMDVEGGLVTSNRVEIDSVSANQVINAEPYLRYMEDRVFSDLGIPGILFGRGGTANRSTGDSMTSEMCDRIKAIQKTIELFYNLGIITELLREGGYDPILNPDQNVELKFKENDLDTQIKKETHAIYKYEHNAITEDEMRALLGLDPVTDRALMFQILITQANMAFEASVAPKPTTGTASGSSSKSSSKSPGTKSTNNKQKPTNQHGTKTSPKKMTNSVDVAFREVILDAIDTNTVDAALYTTMDYISEVLSLLTDSHTKHAVVEGFKDLITDIKKYDTTYIHEEKKEFINAAIDMFVEKLEIIICL